MGRRFLFVALALCGLSLLLGATGLLGRLWAPVDVPLAELRAALIIDGDGDADLDLAEQVALLRQENDELRRRLGEWEEVQRSSGIDDLPLTRARIITRTDRQRGHFLEIDKGAIDRVHRGMAVTIGWTLVGVVRGQQGGRSLVQLLTDAQSRLPARLIDKQGQVVDLGVLAGTGTRDRFELRLIEAREGVEVLPGMLVVSADGHGAVPPGLLLGLVTLAEPEDQSDHWRIEVKPLRAVDRVGTVLVLKDTRQRVPVEETGE